MSKPVLLDFFATWCGPCRMQTPILEELAIKMGDLVEIRKVDVDQHMDLAEKYGIRVVPTLVIEKDGKIVQQMEGVTDAATLEKILTPLIPVPTIPQSPRNSSPRKIIVNSNTGHQNSVQNQSSQNCPIKINENSRDHLIQIINDYGIEILDAPKQLKSLLIDSSYGQNKKEIYALINVLEEKIPHELLKGFQTEHDIDMISQRFSKRIVDNFGISEDLARWAVDSWIIAIKSI